MGLGLQVLDPVSSWGPLFASLRPWPSPDAGRPGRIRTSRCVHLAVEEVVVPAPDLLPGDLFGLLVPALLFGQELLGVFG